MADTTKPTVDPGMVEIYSDLYLGDGVYAKADGYGIRLDLRGQDDATYIYLEPEVLRGLVKFAQQIGMFPTEERDA